VEVVVSVVVVGIGDPAPKTESDLALPGDLGEFQIERTQSRSSNPRLWHEIDETAVAESGLDREISDTKCKHRLEHRSEKQSSRIVQTNITSTEECLGNKSTNSFFFLPPLLSQLLNIYPPSLWRKPASLMPILGRGLLYWADVLVCSVLAHERCCRLLQLVMP
jgi:hypothetical protein